MQSSKDICSVNMRKTSFAIDWQLISLYFQIPQPLFLSPKETQPLPQVGYKSSPRPIAQFDHPQRLHVSSFLTEGLDTLKIDVGVIEQENFNRATIVLINDPSACVNEMFNSYD